MALTDFFTEVCMMDKKTVEDGYGGVTTRYTEGARFKAGIVVKQSTQARIAYQQGVKTLYSIVFLPTVKLNYGDRIKRLSDGLVLKVTSDSRDMETPEQAELKMAQVSAEVVTP